MKTGEIVVVKGVRRAGKSTLTTNYTKHAHGFEITSKN